MVVKWHGLKSTTRDLPGGGPQGCTFGLLEYKSNSNDNVNHVPIDMRFKFVDDLSILEKLNLVLIGLSSYNFRNHVASDVGINDKYLPSCHINSQNYLDQVENWTEVNQMKLNIEKSKVIVFNFTVDSQFATRLFLENTLLETITQTKLLGTIIQSDLKWSENTDMIAKKGYQRMIILRKLYAFNISDSDLVNNIYNLYIRSILEQNCQVWHYDITQEEKSDLERVQKVATKIILQDRYTDYNQALSLLNMEPLGDRRDRLCLNFAKKCLKHKNTKDMFPLHTGPLHTGPDPHLRNPPKYEVQFASTGRLMNSTIPQLQRALNRDASK